MITPPRPVDITPQEAMARLRMTPAEMARHIRNALPTARRPYATFQLVGGAVVVTNVVESA